MDLKFTTHLTLARIEKDPWAVLWLTGPDCAPSPPSIVRSAHGDCSVTLHAPRASAFSDIHFQVFSVLSLSQHKHVFQPSGSFCVPLGDLTPGRRLKLRQLLNVRWEGESPVFDHVDKGHVAFTAVVPHSTLRRTASRDADAEKRICSVRRLHASSRHLDGESPELDGPDAATPRVRMEILERLMCPLFSRGEVPIPSAAAVLFRRVASPDHGLVSRGCRAAASELALWLCGISGSAFPAAPAAIRAQVAVVAAVSHITLLSYSYDWVIDRDGRKHVMDRMVPMTFAQSGDCDDAAPAVATIVAAWGSVGVHDSHSVSSAIGKILRAYAPAVTSAVVDSASADGDGDGGVTGHSTCLLFRRDRVTAVGGRLPSYLQHSVSGSASDLPPILFAEGTGMMVPHAGVSGVVAGVPGADVRAYAEATRRLYSAIPASSPKTAMMNLPFTVDASGRLAPVFFQLFGHVSFPTLGPSSVDSLHGVMEWSIHRSRKDASERTYGVSASEMFGLQEVFVTPLTTFTPEELSAMAKETRVAQSPEPCMFVAGEKRGADTFTIDSLRTCPSKMEASVSGIVDSLNALFDTFGDLHDDGDGTRVPVMVNATNLEDCGLDATWSAIHSSGVLARRPKASFRHLSESLLIVCIECYIKT